MLTELERLATGLKLVMAGTEARHGWRGQAQDHAKLGIRQLPEVRDSTDSFAEGACGIGAAYIGLLAGLPWGSPLNGI